MRQMKKNQLKKNKDMFSGNDYTSTEIPVSRNTVSSHPKYVIRIDGKDYECNSEDDVRRIMEQYSISANDNIQTCNYICETPFVEPSFYIEPNKDGKTLRRERRAKERRNKNKR